MTSITSDIDSSEPSQCDYATSMSYEQTIAELEELQRQFYRMDVLRRRQMSVIKHQRSQQLRTEYKSKGKDEQIRHVQQRRESMEQLKTQQMQSESDRKQRKTQSRLKLREIVGATNHTNHQQSWSKRRESAMQRKQALQEQQQQDKKQAFLEKQKQRELQIARALNKRKNLTTKQRIRARPKSVSHSFALDENHYNGANQKLNRSVGSLSEMDCLSSSDFSFLCDKRPDTKRTLSKSKSMSLTSDDTETVLEKREPLRTIYSKPNTRRRKSIPRYMKPTLSAYLSTTNITTMFASC